jgi:hypothetical protein
MIRPISWFLAVMLSGVGCLAATAATTVFFNDAQTAVPVAEGVTWDTIRCQAYQFTYTRDKLFTGGTGQVIGRSVRIPWPAGLEAQAVTTPPAGVTNYKALITLSRVDGDVFDLTAFTAKLLASTAGAGGSIEIMPLLDGEDALNDPLYFNATGQYGSTFSYDESPSYQGSTAALKGFAAYKIGLYVDFALTALALEGAAVTPPGDFDLDGDVDGNDLLNWQRGESPSPLSAEDLASWEHNFGASLSGNASRPVPEPSTLVMLAFVGLSWRPSKKAGGARQLRRLVRWA